MAGKLRVVTVDGGAVAGSDFEAVDKIFTFKKGEFYKIIEVVIHDDDEPEDDEQFYLQLKDAKTGKDLLGPSVRTTVTILDNDHAAHP